MEGGLIVAHKRPANEVANFALSGATGGGFRMSVATTKH